ncbi:hydantoinase B/oxoprolinase family protein [Conexibacter sp. CPCC 205706]|nr:MULTISPECIES: hydantoinase B/oxoprolinase family protein [unclassified Conexibacter]MDO8187769.1 hydantoinase B/oxoprolinase family protein [Conexibacter sp. CPCC 205706]MDO8201378.1 hydantoinase B/oxoprolinase family protein [Conexibacter sp. CPCC 205762]
MSTTDLTAPSSAAERAHDPVTLEVVRMRLDAIVDEMAIAMMRSSGSPVITESGDFNTALFDAQGRIYAYSNYVQFHIGSAKVALQGLLDVVPVEQMAPGDAFISNDSHTAGSTHPPDVSVITPIFHGETVVGFAQSQAHLLDVGGMNPGGFAPGAVDCFAEALRMPPGVKIHDRGEVVESVRRMIVNNIRLPIPFWNDVRSLVAANNTGARRLQATIEEFGAEAFGRYAELAIEAAREVVAERVRALPDGVYEATEWQEGDGKSDELRPIRCRMTVDGDSMELDFSASSEQTDGFVNCSYGALVGSVATAINPVLAWDLPFNEGVLGPLSVVAAERSIVNPAVPAPASNGHLTVGARVTRLVTLLLNRVVERSADAALRDRAQGIWADSWTGGISAGTRSDTGEYFVLFNMDGGLMGAGAQPGRDGLDGSGMVTQISNMVPDVEMNELMYPVLYLWKRVDPATGGPGAQRGGLGVDFAWTLWNCPEVLHTVFLPCAQVPAGGYGGGFPGGGGEQAILRGVDVHAAVAAGEAADPERLRPDAVELCEIVAQGLRIQAGDVFRQRIAGGGGYGDPLLRDPAAVAADVRDGYVSAEAARAAYGVVLAGGDGAGGGGAGAGASAGDGAGSVAVDAEATAALRREARAARLGRAPAELVAAGYEALAPVADAEAGGLGVRRSGGGWACRLCEQPLGDGAEWRDGTLTRTAGASAALAALGIRVRPREQVELTEHLCPSCGSSLDVAVTVAEAV